MTDEKIFECEFCKSIGKKFIQPQNTEGLLKMTKHIIEDHPDFDPDIPIIWLKK